MRIASASTTAICAFLLLAATPGSADGLQDDVDQAAAIIERFYALPETAIPKAAMRDAKGLAILTVLKAGFGVSAQGGKGVVIARTADGWSGPSAIGTGGGGFGFQIGAAVTEFVIVLNTDAAVQAFSRAGNIKIGADLSVVAGPVGRDLAASVLPTAAVYTYSNSQGLFAGMSLQGAVIVARNDSNERLLRTRGDADRDPLRSRRSTRRRCQVDRGIETGRLRPGAIRVSTPRCRPPDPDDSVSGRCRRLVAGHRKDGVDARRHGYAVAFVVGDLDAATRLQVRKPDRLATLDDLRLGIDTEQASIPKCRFPGPRRSSRRNPPPSRFQSVCPLQTPVPPARGARAPRLRPFEFVRTWVKPPVGRRRIRRCWRA